MQVIRSRSTLVLAVLAIVLQGCASSSVRPVTIFEEPDYKDSSFSNTLVIGVAGDYESRARFERVMASRINSGPGQATAYYAVIGRNKEITRSDVTDAVRARSFDSVILTRIVSQESDVSVKRGASTAKATRKDSNPPVDLFRYDYEVLNNPSTINVASTVVLLTEVYSATDENRVFAMETTISDKENVRLLLDEAVAQITTHLQREGVLRR